MYDKLRTLIIPLLRIDEVEPHAPSAYREHSFVKVFRSSPAYLRYRLFFWRLYAAVWFVAVMLVSVILLFANGWFVLLVLPLIAVAAFKASVLYVVTRLDYELRFYVVTDRSVLIRQGVLAVREITLTFANAQNVVVHQGPLERYFGFANVEVQTAGGGAKDPREQKHIRSHRALLKGLERPEEVRDLVLAMLRKEKNTGLGDPDEATSLLQREKKLLESIRDEASALRFALTHISQPNE